MAESHGMPATLIARLTQWASSQPDKITLIMHDGMLASTRLPADLQRVFTFLEESGAEAQTLTYKDVELRTRALAAHLLDPSKLGATLRPGDRVLLVFIPSLDFILSFLACVRAGIVAVPVYPPDPTRLRAHIQAFTSIAASSGAAVALSHSVYRTAVSLGALKETAGKMLGGLFGAKAAGGSNVWPELHWVNVDGFTRGSSAASSSPLAAGIDTAAADAVAFLQYTSGSTAEPKGVMITHGNLAHNLHAIVTSLKAETDTVVCSWLPQYHDMGLIGSHLGVVYCGGSGYYMSPVAFIKRPVMWLEAVSKYRATHLQSPNFGFKLAARKWHEAAAQGRRMSLDLSSVRHVFNAAEPITVAALHEFVTTFGPYGFSPLALKPGYGLAEHTVYVSDGGDTIIKADRTAFETRGEIVVRGTWAITNVSAAAAAPLSTHDVVDFISCGPVAPWRNGKNDDIQVQIVDRETCVPVSIEDRVGEIWISSGSKASGYWGQPEASELAFQAALQITGAGAAPAPAMNGAGHAPDVPESIVPAGDHAAGEASTGAAHNAAEEQRLTALRYLRTGDTGFIHKGQLYICGRIKDMLIVRGRNYYPQDVEQTAEKNPALRPGCSAAFQVQVESGSGPRAFDSAAAGSQISTGDEGVALAAEVRDAAMTPGQLADVATAIRASVMRDQGLPLAALLLLKPHTARKTTSGKIARKWNQRAFAAMSTDPSSPWHPSSGNVLFSWFRSGEDLPDETALAEGDASQQAPVIDATQAAGAAATATTRDPAIDYASVAGPALQTALQRDVAQLLREPNPGSISCTTSLVDLGMDSLSLTQLAGLLQHEYAMKIADAMLFAEGATISWLVERAADLRAGVAVEAPGPMRGAEPASSAAGNNAAGAAAGAPSSVGTGDLPAPVGVAEVGTLRPPRPGKQASWFERNFPCCVWCL